MEDNKNSNLYNKEGVFGRTMEKIINNKRISILKFIFLISLLYYICWIIWSIYLFFHGIDSGWAMPAMSNGDLMYGFEAFLSGIIIGILYTIELFWFIPLYQVIYLIYSIINYLTKKINNNK